MSELRHDPLMGRWIILSPERGKRLQKKSESTICPFCRGNEKMTPPEILRVSHQKEFLFKYSYPDDNWVVRVVPNKYPALRIEGDLEKEGVGLYDKMNGIGAHEVIIERQNHDLELWDEKEENIFLLLKSIIMRMKDLEKDKRFKYLLVYKNYKEEAGASLTHPHFQLNALTITPLSVAMELEKSRKHFHEKERCLICDMIEQERKEIKRVVYETENFICFCPYASRFIFEMFIAPKKIKHSHTIMALEEGNIFEMGIILKRVLKALSLAVEESPFNLVLHTAPFFRTKRRGYGATIKEDFHWHIHIFPRITKQAGLELGSEIFINFTPPEEAAEFLRSKIKD